MAGVCAVAATLSAARGDRRLFRNAYLTAREFTRPVVISRRAVDGTCTSSIGAYVAINRDGWVVTAAHILRQLEQDGAQVLAAANAAAELDRIKADTTLDKRQRQKRIAAVQHPAPKSTRNVSPWWGQDGLKIAEFYILPVPEIDLAVLRLAPFDPAWITVYPKFKDPSKGIDPGVSLCKLGYPFNEITPTWDDVKEFALPGGGAFPFFPLEGMFTREIIYLTNPPPPFPLKLIETSSPGLRGQSGGPTFDAEGAVWAIQSRTEHLKLEFDLPPGVREAQFLHVGRGASVATMLPLFDSLKINYELATY